MVTWVIRRVDGVGAGGALGLGGGHVLAEQPHGVGLGGKLRYQISSPSTAQMVVGLTYRWPRDGRPFVVGSIVWRIPSMISPRYPDC